MAMRRSGNKIIVEGEEIGAIFPNEREDCYRDAIIDGRNTPFQIGQGAFSSNIEIFGSGTIKGLVFASEHMRCENDGKNGPQCYSSGLIAHGSIVTSAAGVTNIEFSPNANIDSIQFLIRGDIIAGEKITLNNTCVIGSLHAPEVEIQNSIIIGSIDAPKEIIATCSMLGVYKTDEVYFQGPTTCILAGGLSKEKPQFESYISGDDTEYPFRMRYLPFCRADDCGCGMEIKTEHEDVHNNVGLSCVPWLHSKCPHVNSVSLSQCDFVPIELEGKYSKLMNNGRNAWFLNIQGRILNFGPIQEANEKFQQILHNLFAYEHLAAENKERFINQYQQVLSSDEQKLINMALFGLNARV